MDEFSEIFPSEFRYDPTHLGMNFQVRDPPDNLPEQARTNVGNQLLFVVAQEFLKIRHCRSSESDPRRTSHISAPA